MPVSRSRENTNKAGLDSKNLEPTKCPFCKGTEFNKRRGGPRGRFKNVYYINYHCSNTECDWWFSGWELKWYKEKRKEML